jgi:hypothetical protein
MLTPQLLVLLIAASNLLRRDSITMKVGKKLTETHFCPYGPTEGAG